MSGQLVGEVLDARESGRLDSLSRGDVLALIAIAEKCHGTTRQGSVRMSRIQAAMGASKSTAARAMRRLKDRGLIWVVKRGYESHGTGHANVYRLALFVSAEMTQATENACATQDDTCKVDVHVPNPDMHVSNRDVHVPNPDMHVPPVGGNHDGLYDGTNDGLYDGLARRVAPTKAKAAKRRTQIRDDYMPPERVIATIRAEFPAATNDDLSYQHRKFIDHWRKTGKPMADWDATWRNWMRTANERGELCRRNDGTSRGDAKVTGWLNAGKTQPITPEITPP
jgi:hypothetical protein